VDGWERFTIPSTDAIPPIDGGGGMAIWHEVWTAPAAPIFVVAGALYRIHGDELTREQAAHDAAGRGRFWGIAGTGPADIWADGVARFDGHRWQRSDLPRESGGPLFGARPDRYFLISLGIWTYDGARWEKVREPSDPETGYFAVHGSGAEDVHVVGSGALHFDGASWREVSVPQNAFLRSVWARRPGEAYAGGWGRRGRSPKLAGLLCRYDGTAWQEIESPTPASEPVVAVAGCDERLYVASNSAVHERDAGGRWRSVLTASPEHTIKEVFCSGDVLIVAEPHDKAPGRPSPESADYRRTTEEVTVWVRR
jgi:hypothetical protein